MSKQESKSKARHLLSVRLIEPKIVVDFEQDRRKEEEKLRGVGSNSGVIRFERVVPELAKMLADGDDKLQKAWSLGKGLLESFSSLRAEADSPISMKKVDWITTLTVRSGYLFLT